MAHHRTDDRPVRFTDAYLRHCDPKVGKYLRFFLISNSDNCKTEVYNSRRATHSPTLGKIQRTSSDICADNIQRD